MVAPESVTLLAGTVSVPPQVVAAAGEVLTVRLLGSMSVNPTAVSTYAFELLKVMVRAEVPFTATLAGVKLSDTVGAFGAVTVSVAELVAALPPAGPVVRAFAAMVLV